MIIYKHEASIDGLAEKIKAQSSIAYITQLETWHPSVDDTNRALTVAKKQMGHTVASILDDDLYYTKSILVSTNWNKNDDVFDRVEVWAARNTPSHKPTNIEHDETKLVGHITDVWAINNDGNIIPDNTLIDDLPNLYHLVNGAVIYTNWEDDDLIERTQSLIASIKSGSKFVSMEARFSNFGYAIITPEKEFTVLARNEETSFLTKHLCAYGGKGEYDGCRVGRLLRNITFSGKGYVDKPANAPDENNIGSIIFNNSSDVSFDFSKASTKNPFKTQSGVIYSYAHTANDSKQEGFIMPETTMNSDLLQRQCEKLERTVAELQEKNEELKTQLGAAGTQQLKDQIGDLEASLAQAKKDAEEEKKKKDEAEKAMSDLQTKLDAAEKAQKDAETKLAEVEATQLKVTRVATLVDGGIKKDVAEAKVELFSGLSDEQFTALASELIAAVKAQNLSDQSNSEANSQDTTEAEDSDDITTDDADANADNTVVDDAETEETVSMSTQASDSTEDETEATRLELQHALARFLPHTGRSFVNDDESAEDEE